LWFDAVAGVGVVMDDVYPNELFAPDDPGHSISPDYLVVLTALPSELEYQLRGSELAPAAGRLYSVRELATLKATSAEDLAAKGFADFLLPPKKAEEAAEEPTPVAESNDTDPSNEEQEAEEGSPPDEEDGGRVLPEEIVPPPEPTPAERNEIEPPREPTLPFGSIATAKLARGYGEYVVRMERELAVQRAVNTTDERANCQLVVVLATQSLHVIRDHCIQAITGVSTFALTCTAVVHRDTYLCTW
jgi:hypothetical protein